MPATACALPISTSYDVLSFVMSYDGIGRGRMTPGPVHG